MKFPLTIQHRRATATIYGKNDRYPYYRVSYYAAGRRAIRSFSRFSDAREEAEKKVRQLSKGDQNIALTAKEAAGALAIRDALDAYRRETGRTVTSLQAVTHYLHVAKLLGERRSHQWTLGDEILFI